MPINDLTLHTAVTIIRRIVIDQEGHAGKAVTELAVKFLIDHGWLNDARLTERPRYCGPNESTKAM